MNASEVKADLTGDGQIEPAGAEFDFVTKKPDCPNCVAMRL